jgi:hypothetical protein
VRQSIIARNPIPNLSILVVWIDMLPGDNSGSATSSGNTYFSDTDAIQFHDPERRAGGAFGAAFGGVKNQVAWDFYMFFEAGELWEKKTPLPRTYVHQLKRSRWASEDHFTSGRALFDDLYRAAEKMR